MALVVIPLSKTRHAWGRYLVFTQGMGDLLVVRQMSGGQRALHSLDPVDGDPAMQYACPAKRWCGAVVANNWWRA